MAFNLQTSQNPIADLFSTVWSSGCVTRRDRLQLMTTILQGQIGEEERAAIDRLLYAVRRGWLRLID